MWCTCTHVNTLRKLFRLNHWNHNLLNRLQPIDSISFRIVIGHNISPILGSCSDIESGRDSRTAAADCSMHDMGKQNEFISEWRGWTRIAAIRMDRRALDRRFSNFYSQLEHIFQSSRHNVQLFGLIPMAQHRWWTNWRWYFSCVCNRRRINRRRHMSDVTKQKMNKVEITLFDHFPFIPGPSKRVQRQ